MPDVDVETAPPPFRFLVKGARKNLPLRQYFCFFPPEEILMSEFACAVSWVRSSLRDPPPPRFPSDTAPIGHTAHSSPPPLAPVDVRLNGVPPSLSRGEQASNSGKPRGTTTLISTVLQRGSSS